MAKAFASAGSAVISPDPALNEVGRRVQSAVEAANDPILPSAVIRELRQEGFPEELLRIAILYLIDHDLIELTRDRTLAKIATKNGTGYSSE